MESNLQISLRDKLTKSSNDKQLPEPFKGHHKKKFKVMTGYTQFIRDKKILKNSGSLVKINKNSRNTGKTNLSTKNQTALPTCNNSLFSNKLLITNIGNHSHFDILMNYKFTEKEANPDSIKKADKCDLLNQRKKIIAKLIDKKTIQNNYDNSFELDRLLSTFKNKTKQQILLEKELNEVQQETLDNFEFDEKNFIFENFCKNNHKKNQEFFYEKFRKINLPTFPSTLRVNTQETHSKKYENSKILKNPIVKKNSFFSPNQTRDTKFKDDEFLIPHLKNSLYSYNATENNISNLNLNQTTEKFSKESILKSKNFLPEKSKNQKYHKIISKITNPNTMMSGKYKYNNKNDHDYNVNNFNKNIEFLESNARNSLRSGKFLQEKIVKLNEKNFRKIIREFATSGTILEFPNGKDFFILYSDLSSEKQKENLNYVSSFDRIEIEHTYIFKDYLETKYNSDYRVEIVEGRVRDLFLN